MQTDDPISMSLSLKTATPNDSDLRTRILEELGDHDDKIHMLKWFFPISRIHHPVFIGNFGWTSPSIKQRWLLEHAAISIGRNFVTPPQVARAYLRIKYKKRRRVTSAQYEEVIQHRRTPPIFASAGNYREMVYMDIKSAYWSIIRAVGWDVDYFPNKWLSASSNCTDFPYADNRTARNSLLTVGLPNKGVMWTGKAFKATPARNSLANIMIWNFAQDVLNGIAADMLTIGAKYINIDGYIIPQVHEELSHAIANSWGLEVKRKAIGDAHVVHVGKYKVGEFETAHYDQPSREMSFSKIHPVNREWLRPRVQHLLSRRIPN